MYADVGKTPGPCRWAFKVVAYNRKANRKRRRNLPILQVPFLLNDALI
jgi:hypothetical protein